MKVGGKETEQLKKREVSELVNECESRGHIALLGEASSAVVLTYRSFPEPRPEHTGRAIERREPGRGEVSLILRRCVRSAAIRSVLLCKGTVKSAMDKLEICTCAAPRFCTRPRPSSAVIRFSPSSSICTSLQRLPSYRKTEVSLLLSHRPRTAPHTLTPSFPCPASSSR